MKLSKTQQNVLDVLDHTDQVMLVRLPGGFWTTPTCERKDPGNVPTWWVNIQTVRAMERLGLLKRANHYPQEWLDTRVLVKP